MGTSRYWSSGRTSEFLGQLRYLETAEGRSSRVISIRTYWCQDRDERVVVILAIVPWARSPRRLHVTFDPNGPEAEIFRQYDAWSSGKALDSEV